MFLYPAARQTGLQTTVGLGYGKFSMGNGVALNAYNNIGLFRGLQVSRSVLTDRGHEMLIATPDAVAKGLLRVMLYRAVNEQWVEKEGGSPMRSANPRAPPRWP